MRPACGPDFSDNWTPELLDAEFAEGPQSDFSRAQVSSHNAPGRTFSLTLPLGMPRGEEHPEAPLKESRLVATKNPQA